jgi:DNA-binding PadR family transcriptional regulator
LTLTEWAVLALVAERPTHGFAISKELAPNGDVGQIWTVPRPMVYRTLATLEQLGLVESLPPEPGNRGPIRTRLRATRVGESAVARWLATPASHVRDLRTRLLLQFRLLDRRGLDLVPLATAHLDWLVPIVAARRAQAEEAEGFAALLARWRLESAEAAARVLESLVTPAP